MIDGAIFTDFLYFAGLFLLADFFFCASPFAASATHATCSGEDKPVGEWALRNTHA
jgi:hypothetical protein